MDVVVVEELDVDPGDVLFLATSIILFAMGAAIFGGLFLLLRSSLPEDEDV